MKARTLIITAIAMFAIAAPAAQARMLPTKTQFSTHHKIAPTHKVAAKQTAAAKAKAKGKGSKPARTAPLYIFIPGTPNQASAAPADTCEYSMNDCTDEQLCSIWGMNCDITETIPVPTVAAPAELPAADSTPAVETATSDSSAADSDQVASSTDNNSSTDDSDMYEDC